MQNENILVFIIILLAIGLIVFMGICFILRNSRNKYKNQNTIYKREIYTSKTNYNDLSNQYSSLKKNYNNLYDENEELQEFKEEVEEKEEIKKEKQRNRRVSPKMKQLVLERDNYTCQICGISRGFLDSFIPGLGDFLSLHIDHINPVDNGGTGKEEDNLQVLCWRCNGKKSKKVISNEEIKSQITWGIQYLNKKENKDSAEENNEENN